MTLVYALEMASAASLPRIGVRVGVEAEVSRLASACAKPTPGLGAASPALDVELGAIAAT